jgi:RNA polymerase sigma factor (TIGR02999 family)
MEDVTELLQAWSDGDDAAQERLWPIVYEELRRMAGALLRGERTGHTLQATALVHEAYLRLVDQNRVRWQDRQHFFSVAARMMRRILVDHARRLRSDKRGGDLQRVPLDAASPAMAVTPVDLIDLDAALDALDEIDPDKVRIVELRYFVGMTSDEVAELLGCSTRTAKRHWAVARAWLYQRLSGEAADAV